MVKIRNVFGDEYKGRQGNAVYQKFYGRQVRRLWDGRKKNKAPGQEEQKKRFKIGLAFWSSLSQTEREFLRQYVREHYETLTPQQWAVKMALSRPRAILQTEQVKANVVEWRSDWDAVGWYYRQAVTITNNTATDLTDFQVKLILDGSNVGANFDWSRQGADLRFYDENGNKLSYYVESWDETNKQAVVWVKVLSIGANSSTNIKMYYGNSQATSESDPTQVFDFFDDFEVWEGWTQYGSGVVSQSSTYVKHGQYALRKTGYGDPSGGYKAIGKTLGRNIILEAWIMRDYNSGANADRIGVIDDSGNGYGFIKSDPDDYIAVDKRTGYNAVVYGKVTAVTTNKIWYWCQLVITDSEVISQVVDDGGTLKQAVITDTDYNQFTRVYVFGGYPYNVDYMRVRKYAEQEPKVSIGAEEQGVTYTEGIKTIYVKAIKHVAIKKVELYDSNGQLLGEWDNLSNLTDGKVTTMWRVPDEVAEQAQKAVVYSLAGTVDIVQW